MTDKSKIDNSFERERERERDDLSKRDLSLPESKTNNSKNPRGVEKLISNLLLE